MSGSSGTETVSEASRTLEDRPSLEPRGRLLEAPDASGDLTERDTRRRERIRRRDAVHRRALAVGDALAVALTLVIGTVVFGEDRLTPSIVGALLGVILLMKVGGLYDRDEHLLHKTTLDEIPSLFQIAALSALLLWLAGDLVAQGQFGRRQIFGIWALLLLLLVIGRSLARFLARRVTPPERCLVLGDYEAAELFRSKLQLNASVGARFVGWVPLEIEPGGGGSPPAPLIPPELPRLLVAHEIDRVVVAPGRVDPDALMHFVRTLSTQGVAVSVLPATPAVPGSFSEVDQLHGLTLLGVRNFEMGRSSLILKRGFDLIASGLLLLLFSPLLLAIGIAIRVDSRGPILFRQRRIGRGGQPFRMLKFRSMHEHAEDLRDELMDLNDSDGLFKIERDPRVTRVGQVLRRWSLDELPQLVNVLRGEMSLVGPRPLVPDEDSRIAGHFRRRLDLAPGMTGYWQSLGSSRIPLAEMVRLDYLYVATWSLWRDARILLHTIPYVLGGKSR
jgi:exopolysaccharide biosynthesis polyprenyl glycosylphosphotransferase